MNKEGWGKAVWLSGKIKEVGDKIDAVFSALTNIQLVINGIGSELVGTIVTVTDGTGTFQGTFSESLKLVFQLETLGTYTITYVQGVDGDGNVTYGTTEVVISEYGYYTTDVTYFPGYDIWQYWCELGGVDSADYASLEELTADSIAMTMLMNVDNAVDYMILSTGVIMPAVVLDSTALLAAIRSSYALSAIKSSTDWRTAIVGNETALKAIKGCSDVIKSVSASASVSDVYGGGSSATKESTKNATIKDENMLLIATYARLTGSGTVASNNSASAKGIAKVNGSNLFTLDSSGSNYSGTCTLPEKTKTLYNTKTAGAITQLTSYVSMTTVSIRGTAKNDVTFYYI